jgi:hypothetical protein
VGLVLARGLGRAERRAEAAIHAEPEPAKSARL